MITAYPSYATHRGALLFFLSIVALLGLVMITMPILADPDDPGNSTQNGTENSTDNMTSIINEYSEEKNLDILSNHKKLVRVRGGNTDNLIVYPGGTKITNAREFLLLHEAISVIWYQDRTTDEAHFYISEFGGAGENFDLIPGQRYNIVVRKDVNITLPSH